ncbi:hypothetical protein GALMADRAFT_1229689 [Galerina marginata CBS 339.88]|uniref:Uncharacterized protein n=1 Tax=Galerina marginata (strain CBS 339.88) TaxID=685588 RepID=A0A067TA36_GALM3|nr:hypothetical protein GALMADRAFT_1229689 [Galerina marginata CBS 339.88]
MRMPECVVSLSSCSASESESESERVALNGVSESDESLAVDGSRFGMSVALIAVSKWYAANWLNPYGRGLKPRELSTSVTWGGSGVGDLDAGCTRILGVKWTTEGVLGGGDVSGWRI